MTNEEIVAVLAHEIGHYKKKHTLKMLAFSVVEMLVVFYIL
jgi:STE24 endopeptidase